ncbi:MAG: hypothetical protein JOZ77_08730 [Candidatus Eremiobacteraeota bacterium]|nr:hypothetical protein [Candidatus Eremiobacteraeota bacterium]
MADIAPLSFATDIRSMFTEMDVEHMQAAGIDLSDRASVQLHADVIYETVSSGTMPPPNLGEARWTSEMCERFRQWQTQGCQP